MTNPDARMVRGLSIAVVVVSSLFIACSLLAFIFLGISGAALDDPHTMGYVGVELNSDPEIVGELNHYSLDADDVMGLASLGIGILVALNTWLMICSVVALIAGILGLRRYDRPDKLGGAFGWAVAGAVASLLTGNLITMVLLIVSAVYIGKLRKGPSPYAQPYGYGQPTPYPAQPYSAQPADYGQPAPQPYQPPYQQPDNPAAPQSPTTQLTAEEQPPSDESARS